MFWEAVSLIFQVTIHSWAKTEMNFCPNFLTKFQSYTRVLEKNMIKIIMAKITPQKIYTADLSYWCKKISDKWKIWDYSLNKKLNFVIKLGCMFWNFQMDPKEHLKINFINIFVDLRMSDRKRYSIGVLHLNLFSRYCQKDQSSKQYTSKWL